MPANAEDIEQQRYDLLVVGGGVNGAGIARDAAGRGLKVLLCEKGDLAGATSSASSKLIHGGLRYLEYYEFRLVREALLEREVLLDCAPHIIWPLRFVLPHDKHLRPTWMIRAGLFLYDHLARRRSLPGSAGVDFRRDAAGQPMKPEFHRGFVYSDCWVDDARLVVLLAMDAAERGARVLTRTECVAAERGGEGWIARLRDRQGKAYRVRAGAMVNAAGPWVGNVLAQVAGRNDAKPPRLVKGSHIVVPRLYEGEHAYILQNRDRRIVFVIPYEGRFSLIGTTDVPFDGDPSRVSISPEETAYLCEVVGRWFRRAPSPADVTWSYAGVRPLFDDQSDNPSAVTRDYVLKLEDAAGQAPLLSIYGGKITTFRRLAEHALEKLAPHLPAMGPAWTSRGLLPGGDLGGKGFADFLAEQRRRYGFLPAATAERMAHAYGSRIERVLDGAHGPADLGRDLGAGLSEREAQYLIAHEWAVTAEDILWRRSKLGLHGPSDMKSTLSAYLAQPGAAA
ncbi:MAG: glycerol-3-phosphate dehydrogenase [Alphaproteobacteria bacterium]|nr:glycerol-3-phosphate dehydrogenase [Alphaproteobacteria bacterium]